MTAKSLEAQGIQGPRVEKTGSQKKHYVTLNPLKRPIPE